MNKATITNHAIDLVIIPYHTDCALVVPKKLVGYILPFAPLFPSSYQHQAMVGSLIYQNEKIPVVDLACLLGKKPTYVNININGTRRIVILLCITQNHQFSNYGVISSGVPRLIQAQQSDFKESENALPEYTFSEVILGEQNSPKHLYIPDIEAIESHLFHLT